MTGTRNVLRSLGGVAGVAVSTAAYHSVMASTLGKTVPETLRKSVLEGSWRPGDEGSERWEADILGARMEGFRTVFIMQIPLMAVCLLGSLFIADLILQGDPKKEQSQGAELQTQEHGEENQSAEPSQAEGPKAEPHAEGLSTGRVEVREPRAAAQPKGEQSASAIL